MNREPAAIRIIRPFTQQIEQLRVRQTDEKVKAGVCVGHDEEQRCTLVSDGVQVQFIIGRNLAKHVNIKDREPRTTTDQDGFSGFA